MFIHSTQEVMHPTGNKVLIQGSCLSSDTKPTTYGDKDIEDDSLLLELDTTDLYYMKNGTWTAYGE